MAIDRVFRNFVAAQILNTGAKAVVADNLAQKIPLVAKGVLLSIASDIAVIPDSERTRLLADGANIQLGKKVMI